MRFIGGPGAVTNGDDDDDFVRTAVEMTASSLVLMVPYG
jgi:hypothetical protein